MEAILEQLLTLITRIVSFICSQRPSTLLSLVHQRHDGTVMVDVAVVRKQRVIISPASVLS